MLKHTKYKTQGIQTLEHTFRMNKQGRRLIDFNLVHIEKMIIVEKVLRNNVVILFLFIPLLLPVKADW